MPNRASLLTGRYPTTHGLRYNGTHLSKNAHTFVDVLAKGGYDTAMIGKSHLQPMTKVPPVKVIADNPKRLIQEAWRDDGNSYDDEMPTKWQEGDDFSVKTPFYGFNEVVLVDGHGDFCGGHYYQWLKKQTSKADWYRDRANTLPHDYSCPQAFKIPLPEELYSTSYIKQEAISYLEQKARQETPFLAYVSFNDPHHPFTPPGKYWDMYDPQDFDLPLPFRAAKNPTPPLAYCHKALQEGTRTTHTPEAFMATDQEVKEAMALTAGSLSMIDDCVGEILQALEKNGLADNTVVIFTSDHGDYLGDFNLLLKGCLLYESVTRVPFIWYDPQRQTSHRDHIYSLCSTVDIASTIAQRAGFEMYNGNQGHALLNMLQDDEAVREALMMEYIENGPKMGFTFAPNVRTFRSDAYRLSILEDTPWGELYDLKNDPKECHNLFDDPAYTGVKVESMHKLLNLMAKYFDASPIGTQKA